MAVSRDETGPLINAELFQFDDVLFWDRTRPPEIEAQDTDKTYIVKTGERIDLLAHRELGDMNLWWVIMVRNNLRLIPNDFVPGMKINIPTVDSLHQRGVI